MSVSYILLRFCLFFIGGIFINSLFINIPWQFLWGILILGIFFISVFWRRKKIVIFGFCLFFLILGIFCHQRSILKISDSKLSQFNEQEQNVVVRGVVAKEPETRAKTTHLVLGDLIFSKNSASENNILQNKNKPLKEKILIIAQSYEQYGYGDELEITGKLESPIIFEGFNYKQYLAKEGIYSTVYFPQIKLLNKAEHRPEIGAGSLVYIQILNFKNKLREVVSQNLSPPQSSILAAMLLGDKKQISSQWKEKLNTVGLSHITCISGMHIIILINILMAFLIALGLWRQQAFYMTIVIITFFIIMTGWQSSAIRAGIMGGLFLWAQHLGRGSESYRVLVFAGTLMLIGNPLLLRDDIGFQLSFLAITGIIYFLPAFKNWLNVLFKGKFLGLKNILAMTFAAQTFCLPILIYNFGFVSLVSPLANLLIVPLLPLIMIFGFVFIFIGIFSQFAGWILSWPIFLLFSYATKTINWLYGFDFARMSLQISWIWLAILYLILVFAAWRLSQSYKLKFLKY